jgi:hypothetical protein
MEVAKQDESAAQTEVEAMRPRAFRARVLFLQLRTFSGRRLGA